MTKSNLPHIHVGLSKHYYATCVVFDFFLCGEFIDPFLIDWLSFSNILRVNIAKIILFYLQIKLLKIV